jgi:hypothetical protein
MSTRYLSTWFMPKKYSLLVFLRFIFTLNISRNFKKVQNFCTSSRYTCTFLIPNLLSYTVFNIHSYSSTEPKDRLMELVTYRHMAVCFYFQLLLCVMFLQMLYTNTSRIPPINQIYQTYETYTPGHRYQLLFPWGHSHTAGSTESCDVLPHNDHMFSPSHLACT